MTHQRKNILLITGLIALICSLFLWPPSTGLSSDKARGDRGKQGRPPDRYACDSDTNGHCIFKGKPHSNGLKPGTNQVVDRNNRFLFLIDEVVAANSSGRTLRASGRPAFDGDHMVKASVENLSADEKAFHKTMAIMFPIRNALMYDIADLSQRKWELLVKELAIRKIKDTTFTGGPTPRDNYYGRQGIFNLAKNARGRDIHHEIMKFLEESGIFLLCHLTSIEFNQKLKERHPEGHDPCGKTKNSN